jgi:hypothetical protein
MDSKNDSDTPEYEPEPASEEDIHSLIQENHKLQQEVISLNVNLQDLKHRLREYVNDKLTIHHNYHPTDLPWFWQDFNSQNSSGVQV